MGNAPWDLDQVQQIASKHVFVDLQANLNGELGKKWTWWFIRGCDICSRTFGADDRAGRGRGAFDIGQAAFAPSRKWPYVILPRSFLPLSSVFEGSCEAEGNDDWEKCTVAETLEHRVQIVHLYGRKEQRGLRPAS